MTALVSWLERQHSPVIDEDVLTRLLLRYGLGQGEQAAIRAFGRIVSSEQLAQALLERLNLVEQRADDGPIEPALRDFCRELARIDRKSVV